MSEIALLRCSGSTIIGSNAEFAGAVTAMTTPRNTEITDTLSNVAVSDAASPAIARAPSIARTWQVIITRRRSKRSAIRPPTLVRSNMGTNEAT